MQEPSLALAGVIDLPVRRVASVSFHDTSSPMDNDAILRKGKWTTEEEDYANKIISLFNRGLLSIAAGTTLRSYLSDKLHCDPMRITKKFAGASCIGKQVFQPSDSLLTERFDEIEELEGLEVLFFHRVGDRSGTGCRLLTEERCDTTGISRKNDSVKWNREEGDADIAAAKHRTSFGKIKLKSTRPVATVGLGIGMRSVVSAPDFSQLKLMHENVQKIAAANHLRDFPGPVNKIQRSQSAMDLIDFEHYISDDSAAGDLLMQFASKVNDTQSDDDNEDNSEEASGENTGPVTKFISISTIGCNNTTVNNINVNKSLKNRSESATNFDSTMSSKSYNNSSLRTNRSKDNEGGDNEAARNNEIWTDDGAIHVDQSSFLSCSTPLSQVDRGCNYEDEDEDEETVSNCYDNCDTQKNVRIISIDNIKSEDTVIQHRASPFIHRNHDGKKDITDTDPPTGATRVEIKSEFNTELKINDETKLNVLVTVPSIGDRPSPPTATTQPAVTATQKQKHSLPSLLLGGEES